MSRSKKLKNKRNKKNILKKRIFAVVVIIVILLICISFIYRKIQSSNSSIASNSNSLNTSNSTTNTSDNSINETTTEGNNTVTYSDNTAASSKPNTNNSVKAPTTSNISSPSKNEATSNASSNTSKYVVNLPTNSEASKGNAVSVDKANSLLADKLKLSTSAVVYDHTGAKNSTNYYVFQVNSAASGSISWYYVNTSTGQLYSYDVTADKLTPLQ